MNEKQIEDVVRELAQKIKYGEATIEFTFSRGAVVKAIIKETKEVVLFNKA